jgi:hypothetical protein
MEPSYSLPASEEEGEGGAERGSLPGSKPGFGDPGVVHRPSVPLGARCMMPLAAPGS